MQVCSTKVCVCVSVVAPFRWCDVIDSEGAHILDADTETNHSQVLHQQRTRDPALFRLGRKEGQHG
jgi:hypothetical protein